MLEYSMLETLIWILTIILVVVGFFLSIFNLPGSLVIWVAILGNSWFYNFETVSIFTIIVLLIIAILANILDNFGVVIGAKKFGASNWGIIGAIVGSLLGLFLFNIIGLIIGAFLGAFIVELIALRKELKIALKSGFGSFLGYFIGIFIKLILSALIIFIWVLAIIIK